MNPPTFGQCIMAAAGTPELVAQFDRMRGTNLSLRGTQFDLAVDEATGKLQADIEEFLNFVYECIFLPLQTDQ